MSTLFLVIDKDPKAKLDKTTKVSIDAIMEKEDKTIFKNTDEQELFYTLKPEKEFDYVCLIPNKSEVNPNFKSILEDYKENREEQMIYMPLVVLTHEKTKGLLNGCVWNNNLAEEPGILTPDLADKKIDTSLFGCLVPWGLFFDENNYNKELKYYQHFYFLNSVTKNENVLVFGIPKVLVYTNIDLSYSEVDNTEKIKHFKLA